MEVVPIFPVPVYLSDAYAATPAETSVLKTQDWIVNPDGNKFSVNNYILDLPVLAGLRSFLQQQLDTFAYQVLRIKPETSFYITQSWVTVKVRGTSHHLHSHPNSLISGVYYLDGQLSPLAFQRPPTHELFGNIRLEITETNHYNTTDCSFPNHKDRAILFPSTSKHFVRETTVDTPRFSVAFNSFARGLLGDPAGLTGLRL